MSFNKPISSLLPCEDYDGAGFRFEVPKLDVSNPVPGTATFPGLKQEHFPYKEKPPYPDRNKDHMPDAPKIKKSLSTKPCKTTPKRVKIPKTYW